ncbi:MAG TPA: PilZ domain-containing protein [Gemmataceae bacterium]|nr:PilZ domain-containing protein [Gemmataceae bacterium]
MSSDTAPVPAGTPGRVLRCAACGRAERRTTDEIRRLARTAWPVCCGDPIPILPAPDPDGPGPAEGVGERRAEPRRPVRTGVRVEVRRGPLGVGPNLAVGSVDITEAGARVRLKLQVTVGDEFDVTFWPRVRLGPVGGPAVVRWCRPSRAGLFLAGVRFRSRLTAADVRLITDQ